MINSVKNHAKQKLYCSVQYSPFNLNTVYTIDQYLAPQGFTLVIKPIL